MTPLRKLPRPVLQLIAVLLTTAQGTGCGALLRCATTQPMSYEQLAPIVPGEVAAHGPEISIPLRFESSWLRQNSGIAIQRVEARTQDGAIEFTVYRTLARGGEAHLPEISVSVEGLGEQAPLIYVGPDGSRNLVAEVEVPTSPGFGG